MILKGIDFRCLFSLSIKSPFFFIIIKMQSQTRNIQYLIGFLSGKKSGGGILSKISKEILKIGGMSCTSCELRIEKTLRKMNGVKNVKASYADAQAVVEYDGEVLDHSTIVAALEKMDYHVENGNKEDSEKFSINQMIGIGILILALYFILKSTVGFNFLPQVDRSVGYGMLFFIGMLTSLHCIAMCGGINLSQSISNLSSTDESRWSKLMPSLQYNLGRVIAYTIIGGIVGALGSVISFSGTSKAIVTVFAGAFMVVIGINMLNVFPWLRRFNLRMPKFFGEKIAQNQHKRGPFIVGLLNGLMPCGPLQTMQLYALGTGSFLNGALSMFLFSLGTVPLMFGFGAMSSFLSGKFTHRMLKVSAVLVIVLGLVMVNRGLSLSGVSIAAPNLSSNKGNVATIKGNLQEVTTTLESGRYQPFVVQKGIPVRWTIRAKAEDLNGCNNPITIPKYNIQKKLVPGDNVIEFTPNEAGTITYTCWMGMISSTIKVVSDIAKAPAEVSDPSNAPSSAGISGGGCCAASAKATRFRNGRVPTDDLYVVKETEGVQEVIIKVNDQGYSPAAIVVQKGTKLKIKFKAEQLNSCNSPVVFPEFQGQLDLNAGQLETPEIDVTQDFTFQCWMGMLHGYVKVVDDLKNLNLEAIKEEIGAYKPTGGGGCCGG